MALLGHTLHQKVLQCISARFPCLNYSPDHRQGHHRAHSRRTRGTTNRRKLRVKLKRNDGSMGKIKVRERVVTFNQFLIFLPLTENRTSKPPTAGRTPSPSQFPYRLPANQAHPAQPSPSPSRLNNPGMYAAPPPASRPPNNAYSRPQAPPGPPPNSVFYGGGSVSHAPRPPNGPPGIGVNTNAFAGAMNARPAGSYNAPLGPPPPVQGQRPPGTPPAPAGFFDKFTSSWRI